jgi:hypothetical protein
MVRVTKALHNARLRRFKFTKISLFDQVNPDIREPLWQVTDIWELDLRAATDVASREVGDERRAVT